MIDVFHLTRSFSKSKSSHSGRVASYSVSPKAARKRDSIYDFLNVSHNESCISCRISTPAKSRMIGIKSLLLTKSSIPMCLTTLGCSLRNMISPETCDRHPRRSVCWAEQMIYLHFLEATRVVNPVKQTNKLSQIWGAKFLGVGYTAKENNRTNTNEHPQMWPSKNANLLLCANKIQ